jgi:hypothetical protein
MEKLGKELPSVPNCLNINEFLYLFAFFGIFLKYMFGIFEKGLFEGDGVRGFRRGVFGGL